MPTMESYFDFETGTTETESELAVLLVHRAIFLVNNLEGVGFTDNRNKIVLILLFCIYFAPYLDHDPATPLHSYDNIIATDTALSAILFSHLIGIKVLHYSRYRVLFV